MLAPLSVYNVADVYERQADNEQRIWRLFAYIGRYGHQPLESMRRMTMRELRLMSAQLAEIVEEENTPPKGHQYR